MYLKINKFFLKNNRAIKQKLRDFLKRFLYYSLMFRMY